MTTTYVPDTSNKAIGRRFSAVRETRGWSQAYLARQLDVSSQRWGGYERGLYVPPPHLLAKFWQLTGATSDFILFGRIDGLPHELVQALQKAKGTDDAPAKAS